MTVIGGGPLPGGQAQVKPDGERREMSRKQRYLDIAPGAKAIMLLY